MDIETLRTFCKSLPATTEDIKWVKDLCFLVGGKMYCVAGLDGPFGVTLKVPDDEFEELLSREGIVPAPYLARAKWIRVENAAVFKKKEWEYYIRQSYELIRDKLTEKLKKQLKLQ
ncbi:MAG: MmcQ/YjbR family DNA-binding protein [Bacteroidota bacterium]